MTKHDLIDAYVGGRMARRDFVLKLTTLGVSTGAALAYAQTLMPSASAAGGRAANGFVMRAQEDDGDYGAILGFPETVAEALEAAAAFTAGNLTALQELLDQFAGDDFEFSTISAEVFLSTIEDFISELQEQLSVLESAAVGSSSAAKSARPFAALRLVQTAETAEAAVANLVTRFGIVNGYYAGAVPAMEEVETRLLLMSAALLNAQQGAFLATSIGEDPTPSTFVEPITLDEAEAQLEELEGE